MALLPGGGSYHSRIVLWGELNINDGAELGWNPGIAGCSDWPFPDLAPVPGSTWTPQATNFCAGHAQLATGPGLLTVGGDEGPAWGIPDALAFTPGIGASPGNWSRRSDMQQARFYPTITSLRDGRMLVTGGARYQHNWYFGGRVDGSFPTSVTGNLLHRFGRGSKSIWDPPVTPVAEPETNRPSPREDHTAVQFQRSDDPAVGDPYQAFFGGKDGNGVTTDNAVYLLRREDGEWFDPDYKYRWSKLPVIGPFLPPARSDHVAIDLGGIPGRMAIYGGLSQPGGGGPAVVLPDFWKLAQNEQGQWVWRTLPTSGGPGPRYGHAAAFYNGKMYLFGGSGATNANPTDSRVWVFTFDATFASGSWDTLAVTGGPPEPRNDHTMVLADSPLLLSLLLYGGRNDTSPSSSALWRLDLTASPARWSVISTDGPSPGPRANHAASYQGSPTAPRLTIFGGERPTASDPEVDKCIYSINPFSTGNATWVRGPPATYRLSGHTVDNDPLAGDPVHARIPEIFNPSSNVWTPQTGSGWLPPAGLDLIDEYPVQFLVPGTSIPGGGGRVLRVGQDPATRYLDIPAAGLAGLWQTVGSNGDFEPVTGVQYQPGKILVVGGKEEVFDNHPARTFDATTAQWVDRPGMAPRADANVLVLPNGKVLVLGATPTAGQCPQIWDPAGNNNNGSWTVFTGTSCELDKEIETRGYHSTAMLLPDARVLTGGGYSNKLQVYCPPYLFNFNGDDLASRPTITLAPASLVYGESFVINKPVTDQIASVCLIRPAAVTHSFDQNGRYVRLTFETLPDGTGLRAIAPTIGSAAPPGDYLLFILNTQGVPAIARWVHLGNCAVVPCDSDSPPQVPDLAADIVGSDQVWLVWTAPGDDKTPVAGEFDLRMATAPIASEQGYTSATTLGGEPPVAAIGTPRQYEQYGLAPSTLYSFALKTRDALGAGANNWSLRSNTVTVTTASSGGAGGGYSARRVEGGAEGESAVPAGGEGTAVVTGQRLTQPSAALGLAPGGGLLVAETRRTGSDGWQVVLYSATDLEGLDPADAGYFVSQVHEASGSWRTLGRFQPSPDAGPLGLCALRQGGRLVLPAGYGLDRVVTGLRSGGEDFGLAHATHSRLGDLGDRLVASDSTLVLAPGDAITLDYAPSSTALREANSWYLLVRPVTITPEAQILHRLPAEPLPRRFALQPARPNPASGATIIRFDLPSACAVRLEVFDLLGRRMRVLADSEYPAGEHAVAWDGREDNGTPASSGVYLYRMTAGAFRAKRTMVLLAQ